VSAIGLGRMGLDANYGGSPHRSRMEKHGRSRRA
jgi:hypothetical protein